MHQTRRSALELKDPERQGASEYRVASDYRSSRGALLLQQVEYGFVEVGQRGGAQRRRHRQQRKHLLILLQDLLVLSAALVEALHPAQGYGRRLLSCCGDSE